MYMTVLPCFGTYFYPPLPFEKEIDLSKITEDDLPFIHFEEPFDEFSFSNVKVFINQYGLLLLIDTKDRNEAGELLTNARMKYELGNYDQAASLASSCSEISKKVKSEASELQHEASVLWAMDVGLAMTESVILMIAVILGSLWSWRAFKKRYYKRILKMKPEIASHES